MTDWPVNVDDAVDGGSENAADDGHCNDTTDHDSNDLDDRQTAGRRRQVDICSHVQMDTHTGKHLYRWTVDTGKHSSDAQNDSIARKESQGANAA